MDTGKNTDNPGFVSLAASPSSCSAVGPCASAATGGCSRREFLQHVACGAVAAIVLAGAETATPAAQANWRRYPIPVTDGVTIDRDAQVMLARQGGQIVALAIACPHQNAAVRWLASDHRFQCSRHDSKYTPEGVYTSGRATRNLDRFPITRDGDAVVVDTSRVYRSDQDAAGWAAAHVTG